MSNDVMNRIWWREDLTGVTKNVAIALADAASDQGMCFPAVETLARKSGWKKRAVQKALDELEGMGLLRRIRRTDSSSVYQFVLDNLPLIERQRDGHKERDLFDMTGAPGAPHPRTSCTPPVHEVHPPHAPGAPITQSETSDEPSLFNGSLTLPVEDQEQQIIDEVTGMWNDRAKQYPGMEACRLPLDAARRQSILRRSRQLGEDYPTVGALWRGFFARIDASRFLQGRAPPTPKHPRPFKLSLTWALNSANFNKIMEQHYERGNDALTAPAADGRAHGSAAQGTALALSRRRARNERSEARGDRGSHH